MGQQRGQGRGGSIHRVRIAGSPRGGQRFPVPNALAPNFTVDAGENWRRHPAHGEFIQREPPRFKTAIGRGHNSQKGPQHLGTGPRERSPNFLNGPGGPHQISRQPVQSGGGFWSLQVATSHQAGLGEVVLILLRPTRLGHGGGQLSPYQFVFHINGGPVGPCFGA